MYLDVSISLKRVVISHNVQTKWAFILLLNLALSQIHISIYDLFVWWCHHAMGDLLILNILITITIMLFDKVWICAQILWVTFIAIYRELFTYCWRLVLFFFTHNVVYCLLLITELFACYWNNPCFFFNWNMDS